jgi:isorenieratene synthase
LPLVLEAESRWPGGRMSGGDPDTFDHDGRTWSFSPDHGVHALWGAYDNTRATLDRFLDTELQPSPGEEWINRWGREVRVLEAGNAVRSRWIPAPFHYLQLLFHPGVWNTITPLDFLSLPGFLASVLLTVGLDPIQEQIALDGLLMREYFRGWTPNLRSTFVGLGRNLLAASDEVIPLATYIAAVRFYTMLRRDDWQLQYFTGEAHARLIQPMIAAVEGSGGLVMSGVTAEVLEKDAAGWKVRVEDARRGGRRSLLAENVILAVDSPAARRLLRDSPDTRQIADRLCFPEALRNVSVRLWFDHAPRDGTPGGMFTGDFVPDNFFWLHRLYDDFGEWHETIGGSAIELHFYGPDVLFEQSDQNLLVVGVDEIQRAFPRLKGHFVHGVVRRNTRSQTLFRVPTEDSLFVETPWPGILACGDWVGYDTPSLNMERSVVTAIVAANHVLRAHDAEPYPIIPPHQPELLARILAGIIRLFRRLLGPLIVALIRTLRNVRGR